MTTAEVPTPRIGFGRMRILRFRCSGCGLEMALPEKPEKCFCCGSTSITREGWRQRIARKNRKE